MPRIFRCLRCNNPMPDGECRDAKCLADFEAWKVEYARNPLVCYGCGLTHTSDKIGNRDGAPNCLGFIRSDADAMQVLTGVAASNFEGVTVISPGVIGVGSPKTKA